MKVCYHIDENFQFAYIIDMAFDGSMVAALTAELNKTILGGYISKIAQPEKDEILLTVKSQNGSFYLLLSADPSLPVCYLTDEKKAAPLQAPAFCMLLRKHIQGGRFISITQPSLERIIDFEIEHRNEMGDLCKKILTLELMGKHSNIIFRDGTKILDSIRRVSPLVSSIRTVLPGHEYFVPLQAGKLDPKTLAECGNGELLASLEGTVFSGSLPLYRALYTNITGLSPQLSEEIVFRAGIDGERSQGSLDSFEKEALAHAFCQIMETIISGDFSPSIYYDNDKPRDICPFIFSVYSTYSVRSFPDVSSAIRNFYSEKQSFNEIRQKTADLRQIVQTIIARDSKKYDLQLRQLKDTEKKDKYKLYGDLLTAYGYSSSPKQTSFTCEDYNTGETVTIPLDPTLSAVENGKKYYDKYAKLRRTALSLSEIVNETKAEIDHLDSILVSLSSAKNESDIAEIKNEMTQSGYIKGKNVKGPKAKNVKSEPLHFISSDGFHMYVGKNNYQNEHITFELADGGDWWFHAKKIPGSHVIVKTGGKEIPDSTFNEAASLAAHYSKSGTSEKVEVDYIQRKHVKKPSGAKPGFVIYHTNFSMTAVTDISEISQA